ncbi:uncharacterized protein LOC125946093 isoform X3 [Dermacentor silvarum]|uniref:uncharacterized protein LOC125946093 isoform X1 n=1 Tax=Dermacentor silvarum TaxID=543639 RepID=UPI0021006DCB|nr:uncharacterized protein LOC125946093 isoform X1 [Dermacentor silvarum]XP_049524513.1 uncharacterized protein LOC125946093 isoform X2 [Dermacentor silvarum]XP_049524514.1 uncharacterized protein LOC125946093 isoform X3 [Dermacentor silvarum]
MEPSWTPRTIDHSQQWLAAYGIGRRWLHRCAQSEPTYEEAFGGKIIIPGSSGPMALSEAGIKPAELHGTTRPPDASSGGGGAVVSGGPSGKRRPAPTQTRQPGALSRGRELSPGTEGLAVGLQATSCVAKRQRRPLVRFRELPAPPEPRRGPASIATRQTGALSRQPPPSLIPRTDRYGEANLERGQCLAIPGERHQRSVPKVSTAACVRGRPSKIGGGARRETTTHHVRDMAT